MFEVVFIFEIIFIFEVILVFEVIFIVEVTFSFFVLQRAENFPKSYFGAIRYSLAKLYKDRGHPPGSSENDSMMSFSRIP